MAEDNGSKRTGLAQALLLDDPGVLRGIVERALQAILEEEMTAHLGAARYERGEGRTGHRNGSKPRTLTTRVGTIELRVPQDRDGSFSTELFARYQRSEQALVTTLMEMYLQGVSTRNVAAITEELCGTSISKSQVSALVGRLDPELTAWRERPLTAAAYPYLVVDARYEHARVDGRVVSLGVLIVAGVRDDGRREVLAVEEADTESEATYHGCSRGSRGAGCAGSNSSPATAIGGSKPRSSGTSKGRVGSGARSTSPAISSAWSGPSIAGAWARTCGASVGRQR
jgi:putative transposase